MLRILRKTTPPMANSSGSGDDDLSTWEFVNASLSDDEDIYSFDGDDVISEGDDATEEEPESKPVQGEDEDAGEPRDFGSPDVIMSIQSLSVSPPMTLPVEMTSNHVYHEGRDGSDDDDGGDDDVRDVYHDDVDDELVPWKLKDRFGKQRIRKMGKRGGPKPNKSKRLPYYHNRPGCLYGKHGFGVQHSFI
ncbi:uncharacterized protein LOC105169683 [Sesamum indicum]|uniref:Uncharacterized protein LOC105169683 n=1 Tax=Sesamum indicum TaxID=4182 RepID=A0A6I9TQD0_SESIN|nr:uncharacterized protein LOC105169683 [Sesamum indicum]